MPNLGMEQAMRVERGMAEEAYIKSPDLFSPKPYGVTPVEDVPTRRLRFATQEDPADEILGGKLMYEDEASQIINPQGAAKKQLMATPLAEVITNNDKANWLWQSMRVQELGKAKDKTFGRSMWRRFWKHDNAKYKPDNAQEYFQNNFCNWMGNKPQYRKNHPAKAEMLEMMWDIFKPSGC